jgi:two-component system, chemotaxis family, protein-glutamate methylesterase/glutaminase
MTKRRVLVVEDSLTARKRLAQVLAESAEFDVVAEASEGRHAVALCEQLRPDVITMDLQLPGLNGLAATELIMASCPTPILIVSSSTSRDEVVNSYNALAAGAVDVYEKPTGDEDPDVWASGFLTSLRIVSRVRVITHPRARLIALSQPREVEMPSASAQPIDLVAIGASTGGPAALVELFANLPQRFSMPVLVVMHLSAAFAPAFADWLRGQIGRATCYASEGEPLAGLAGKVRLAPADTHMVVRRGRLHLVQEPPRYSCRPSVDVLFESVAREYGARACACLLTGMGRDGANGLLELRTRGALTFAQDEASCSVYGMPREAALLGAAERVLRPQGMAQALAQLGNSNAGRS